MQLHRHCCSCCCRWHIFVSRIIAKRKIFNFQRWPLLYIAKIPASDAKVEIVINLLLFFLSERFVWLDVSDVMQLHHLNWSKKTSRNCKQNALQLWKPHHTGRVIATNFEFCNFVPSPRSWWKMVHLTSSPRALRPSTQCVRRVRVLNIITISNLFWTILNALTFAHNSLLTDARTSVPLPR